MSKRPKIAPFAAPDWPAMNPKMWKLDRIKEYPRNARTHPPAQIALLAELMKRHGVDQPIAVDEDGVILKGHGRKLAAAAAGFEEFPVVQHRGLPEDEKRAMRLADNQVMLLGGWDNELVQYEIKHLQGGGYEVNLLGFGDAQLVSFMATPGPPSQFPAVGEDIETKFQCPRCSYRWSGSASGAKKEKERKKPGAKPSPKPKPKKRRR